LIRAGRVRVNGISAELGDSADPQRDRIELDGQRLMFEPLSYWVLHKPRSVMSTRRDPEGRTTVIDLLPPAAQRLRLFPVGRLDYASEGLILLTNDGALAQRLLHPSYGSDKEYVVTVRGETTSDVRARLAKGFRLGGARRRMAPAEVAKLRTDAVRGEEQLRIVLREGMRQQIRRSLMQLGHPVRKLVRVRIGPLELGSLARGRARPLAPKERAELLRYVAALGGDAQLAPQRPARTRESAARKSPSKRPRRSRKSR
jgi:23S rRNA pseudouridine2605 synthase